MKQLFARAAIALTAAAAAAGVLVAASTVGSERPVPIETEAPAPTVPPTSAPPTTAAPAPTTTTTAPTPVTTVPDASLRPGDKGPDVLALQQRLRSLGYWLGTPDGTYGHLTEQAVTAFQKAGRLDRDGIAGPATRARLESASRPTGRSTRGDLVEVDKARQLLLVIRDGKVAWAVNASTGTEKPYQVNGRTELADTPPGRWEVSWVVDGTDWGEVGGLYRPRYFHDDGIAVHGYADVPPYPASHGCVRVSEAAMDWMWATDILPMGSTLWVY